MKKRNVHGLILTLSVLAFSVTAAERDVSLAGEGWRFTKDPSGELQAEGTAFDDSSWAEVRVPHDWAISGPFDLKADNGYTGKLPWRGVGWYRRTFELAAEDEGSSVFLDFDGVMAFPDVYVNGVKVGGWSYGYESRRVDVTAAVCFGRKNVLAVRADTRKHGSRWYPGAGLYRKVTLRVRHPAHFAWNGLYVTTPKVSDERATVRVAWETEGPVPAGAKVRVEVAAAKAVSGRRAEASAAVAAGAVELVVERPELWDVETPNLHEATVTLVAEDGHALSVERVRFGIRTIAFPVPTAEPAASDWAANGFHLNGRRVQLKGVDLHSDLGLLGMAFDRSAMRRQLELMKDMGANALRTSHNCVAPEVLDLCDEMGILVWDEALDSWGSAADWTTGTMEDHVSGILRRHVRRDRNHPSVIIWSMSNEIWYDGFKGTKTGQTKARCSLFREVMRREDATRPIGNGNIGRMNADEILDKGIFDDLDVTGWNYGASYRNVKKRYPSKIMVYSESASAYSSYGYYPEKLPAHKRDFDTVIKQVDGYDFNAGPDIADLEFDRMEKDVYCCGEFVWTGIDYLGEPTPFAKGKDAARSSYFGIVDLTGVPKDRYWLYRSHWNDRADTLHIVPHWTWPGREGKTMPVFVYTNGDRAELFVNGKSLGFRRKGELVRGANAPTNSYYDVCAKYRLMWFDVPYEPGEVMAVAYAGDRLIGETTVRTAGPAVRFVATPERAYTDDPDELVWMHVDALDAQGVRNPLAMNRVRFRLDGPGEILGVGNGNAQEFEPFTDTTSRRLFFGKAMAVVRRTGVGDLKLTVTADDTDTAEPRRMSAAGDHRLPEKAHVVSDVLGYNSWPMIQAMGEKLVCSYSRDNARPKDGHTIDPGSRDSYVRVSSDGGRTWSPETTVAADPNVGEVNEGIGLDSTGAALLWVRCWGKGRRHELYRTTDGVTLEKIASLTPDPFPMQVMDPVPVAGLGLVSPWFAGSYRKGGSNSWGLLVSADDGRTWTQRVIESGLSVKEWVTEPSLADLGNGRLLIVGRCEQNLGNQFQVTSTDNGKTWKKARTNIADVRESTPSLVYDRATGLLANYYYHRGARKLKRRVVSADFIFDRPDAWPKPEILDTGFETRPYDAGNVKATRFGDTDCCAWYSGTPSNSTVVVTVVPKPATASLPVSQAKPVRTVSLDVDFVSPASH